MRTAPSMSHHKHRPQSPPEELANAISHGLGFVAVLVAAPWLVAAVARRGDALNVLGACVFTAALLSMFLASTLFHSLPAGTAKQACRALDHSAIFILIAGTYTPFALGILRHAVGGNMLAFVWCVAIVGVTLKITGCVRSQIISALLYLAMGWLVFLSAVRPLQSLMPLPGILWLVAGGVAYTFGVAFFAAHWQLFAHLIWHLLVLAGSACHFLAVARYAV